MRIHRRFRFRWRRRAAGAAIAVVLLVGGCSDVVQPVSIASIELLDHANRPLTVGETLMLEADIRDARGESLSDLRTTWTTSDPAIATVDQRGVVTALGSGMVTITASVARLRDSVVLTIGDDASSGCEASAFEIGEVRGLVPRSDGAVCVPAGGSYTVVVTNSAEKGSVALSLSGNRLVGSSPALSLTPSGNIGVSESGPERDWEAESEIRARERSALRGLEASARAARASSANGARLSISSGVPSVGTLMRLNTSTDACRTLDERVGRVMSVSRTTIVVSDTANPKNGFTEADFRHIGATMDTLVVPVVTEAFGTPADIDSNGRVVLFYTRAVNEMTGPGEDSYVGGFFYSRDLFPARSTSGIQGCAGSNMGEIMYMLAPDPAGEVNGNRRPKDFIADRTIGVAAHELQHLINASRRLYVIDATNFDEEGWLNEGLSHIAEELLFYRASGLQPGQDLGRAEVRASAGRLEAFNRYAADNFLRLMDHLENPAAGSPYASDDELSTRGATWSFLRYLADRRGGDQISLWQSVVNTKATGMENLRTAIGADPLLLMRDWSIATFADDQPFQVTTAYMQPSWDFRSIYSGFGSTQGRYPLSISALDAAGTTRTLRAGGSLYLPVVSTAAAAGELRVGTAVGTLPSTVRIVAIRTR